MNKIFLWFGLACSVLQIVAVEARQVTTCEGPGFHQEIVSLLEIKNPKEAELLELSNIYQALGMAKEALEYAELALEYNPKSGSAMLADIHARHLDGAVNDALYLATVLYIQRVSYQFSRGEISWLRHSILSMLMKQSKFETAEAMILEEFPDVLSLADKQPVPLSLDFGLPLHTLEALIHIYRATERGELAEKLARHLKGFSAEAFFESSDHELLPTQNWMLASIWAGNLDERTVPALRMAYEKGFKMGWRFNYPHHPVYWPYRNDPAFLSLIGKIETDMAAQAICLE